MAKAKKTPVSQQQKNSTPEPKSTASPQQKISPENKKIKDPAQPLIGRKHNIRVNLAIGTLTMLISILLLYILNKLIFTNYNPDIKAILDKVLPLTIQTPESFAPEPVERLQYQLSLLCTPFFIFGAYWLVNKKRAFFNENPTVSLLVNSGGILILFYYLAQVLKQDLIYVPEETTKYFFANNAISKYNSLFILMLYAFFTWLFILYTRSRETTLKRTIVNVVCYGIALLVIADIVLYNVFHLAMQEWGRLMETNAVFYSITQVYAGKALLVDINSQYGLYAWFLNPVFKIIGLSTYKFGLVMAALNGVSFLLFYLGLKRIIKQDILSLVVFLGFTWWLYWQNRIPFESTPRFYYQYPPIRILFPALSFYLLIVYQTCKVKWRRLVLPLLALSSSIAVLWNLDTGLVLFGATTIALVYSAIDPTSLKNSIRRSVVYILWMGGAFLVVLLLFLLSTNAHTGHWPDFAKFAAFQNVFYISGFFMLAMSPMHFWNLPVIVYLITCTYCVYQVTRAPRQDTPVIVFLFILGMGIFAYFQGRSYDMNIDAVIYPAIFLLGIFCNKLLPDIEFKKGKVRFQEYFILFAIAFLFLTDGAFSMLMTTPDIHEFAVKNEATNAPDKENILQERTSFLSNNLHQKDTVLILAKDYESYYYASGNYFNPVNLPGSTEIFFKAEIDTLLRFIKNTRYPIIYDALHPWTVNDTIVKTLSQYTTIVKALPDKTMLLLKHRDELRQLRLANDNNTLYYDNTAEFNNYMIPETKLRLPENFTVEFYATLDKSKMAKDNFIFSNSSTTKKFTGILMIQYGNDLDQYIFLYGNGKAWCNGVVCKLSTETENHVVISVQKNMITASNNNVPCGQVNTNSLLLNSDGMFFISPKFAGTVRELRIEK